MGSISSAFSCGNSSKHIFPLTKVIFSIEIPRHKRQSICREIFLEMQAKRSFKSHLELPQPTEAMAMPNTIRVLDSFGPFFRILEAFNRENFQPNAQTQSHQNKLGITFGVVVCIVTLAITLALGIWYLADYDGALSKVAVSGPALLTFAQMLITILTLMAKNRFIKESVTQLQNVVDQRKSTFIFGGIFVTYRPLHGLSNLFFSFLPKVAGTLSNRLTFISTWRVNLSKLSCRWRSCQWV